MKGNKWIIGQKVGEKPRTIATFSGGAVIDERVVPSPDGRRLAVVVYGRSYCEFAPRVVSWSAG